MAAPQTVPAVASMGYSQKNWRDREVRITTAISTARGRKKIIDASRAAINHKPHHDSKLPKTVTKKARILNTNGSLYSSAICGPFGSLTHHLCASRPPLRYPCELRRVPL